MDHGNAQRGQDNPISTKAWRALALLAVLVALNGKALLAVCRLALSNQEYSHLLLVVPVVLVFLIFELKWLAIHSSWLSALFAAFASITCLLASRAASSSMQLTWQIAAFVLAAWAIVLLVYGFEFFRANLFPMLFLLLLIPWPISVVAWLTVVLQSGSTWAAYWLFKIFGVPVTRQGFVLSLTSIDIFVAEECSGIRSTVMLFLTALVLGQLFLKSNWRKAILLVAVLPVGILRNGLRIFILSVLGTYVNEGWLDGNLHHRGGAVFFVIGLALIVGMLWALRRGEAHRKGIDNSPVRPSPQQAIGENR